MTKTLIYSFLLFTILLSGTSCKKETETLSTQKLEAKWKITGSTLKDPTTGADVDIWGEIDECAKDNTYEFTAAGVYVADEGNLQCDPENPQQQITGTYTYTSNDKTLTITTDSFVVVSEVLEISNTTFKTRAFFSTTNPTVTYTRIQ